MKKYEKLKILIENTPKIEIAGETWYTVHQLSRMIEKTTTCVRKWGETGKVEKIKIDGQSYYRLAEGVKVVIGAARESSAKEQIKARRKVQREQRRDNGKQGQRQEEQGQEGQNQNQQ